MANAVRYYEKKLERKVPKTTVRQFKNLYREDLKRKLSDATDGKVCIDSIPKKLRGRPTLLPSELDSRVQVYVLSLRQAGFILNTWVVVVSQKGIVEANDHGLHMENGGTMTLD